MLGGIEAVTLPVYSQQKTRTRSTSGETRANVSLQFIERSTVPVKPERHKLANFRSRFQNAWTPQFCTFAGMEVSLTAGSCLTRLGACCIQPCSRVSRSVDFLARGDFPDLMGRAR